MQFLGAAGALLLHPARYLRNQDASIRDTNAAVASYNLAMAKAETLHPFRFGSRPYETHTDSLVEEVGSLGVAAR